MAERKFSSIKKVEKIVQIPLPATFISNEISGIAEILDSWKRQYVKELQGVVVNYKHFSLSSPTGFIAPNRPFVYYNVKATFDLFCPNIGDVFKGKINRVSNEHIGCLIEDTINATIYLSKDSPKELVPFIYLNHDILFEISSFKFDRKIIRVKGNITHKCIQLMKELFPPPTSSQLVDTPELSNNTDEGIGTSSESADDGLLNQTFDVSKINDDDANFKKPFSTNTKSKKKSKRHRSDSEYSSMDTSDISTSDKRAKKKRKKNVDKSNPEAGDYLSVKQEISSPVKESDNFVPESKTKKKSKDKKSKEKDKLKKKKGKVLASGAVLKKDKKSQKKNLKKNELGGEQSKRHKKGKSHKKDKSGKKKKKDSSKNKVYDVIKSEVD